MRRARAHTVLCARAHTVTRARAHTVTRARAYTVMEVMIGLAVLAIGTMGIVAMQKVTAATNRDARNLVIATQIARTWIDRLKTDAATWTRPATPTDTSNLGNTIWLRQAGTIPATGGTVPSLSWFLPSDSVLGSAAADLFGNAPPITGADAVFCTHVRLNWMPNATSSGPPYALRADVRVFWLRDGGGGVPAETQFCDANVNAVTDATANYHFVYMTSAIMQNVP